MERKTRSAQPTGINMGNEWTWYGHAGHLCVGHHCRFHLCTKIGEYLISTVGDCFLNGTRTKIGAGDDSFFETYVFTVLPGSSCTDSACMCGMPNIDLENINGIRCATAGEAAKTHIEMCRKYAALR